MNPEKPTAFALSGYSAAIVTSSTTTPSMNIIGSGNTMVVLDKQGLQELFKACEFALRNSNESV